MTDTTAPRLTSLAIPSSVDLSSGPKVVTFTAAATDDSSGVAYVIVNFDQSLAGQGSAFYLNYGTGSWATGMSVPFTLPVNVANGVYRIASVDVFDNAGNESIVSQSALQQMGVGTSMTVSGADTTGPVLTGLSFDRTIDLSSGAATFHYSVSATDRSGVGEAVIYFDNGLSAEYLFDGATSSTASIGVATPPGTYHVTQVDLSDTAGNQSIYTAAQLQALGLPTSLTISGSDIVGPTLTGLSFDPKIDLSAGAATFHYSASATDRSGVADAVLRFDGGLGAYYIFGSSTDSWADGSSSASYAFSAATPPGTYHLSEVDLQDTAGNLSTYTTAQLQALGFATTVVVSNSDVTGPTLTGFTHPASVNLSGGAASLTLGVSATDRSGIGSAVITFDKPLFGSEATAYIFGTTADPWTDGSSTVVETVPTSAAIGTYTVKSLQVFDTLGNSTVYTTAQLAALGFSTTIVVGGADTTPPQLLGLTFPTSVDVSASAKTVTFSATASDNATGVKDVTLNFDKNFAGAGVVDIAGSAADPWTDGASSLAVTLPTSTLPGVYSILSAVVKDGAGNTRTYTAAQLQALGIATSLTVVGDSTKPQLTGLTLPTTIDVSNGQKVAAFSATAKDNATGIRDVTLNFDKNLTTGGAGGSVDLNGFADSWSDGASSLSLIIPTTAVAGTYKITSVTVTDGAGNVASYTPAQLAGLGFATSLTIATAASGSPSVTFGPSVSYANGGAAPILTGSFADTVAMSAIRVYNGATLLGTATLNAAGSSWTFAASLAAGSYSALNVVATDASGKTATAAASFSLQTGITGQAYVTIQSDMAGGKLADQRFIKADGSLYAVQSYLNGGAVDYTYYNLTGQPYTSREVDYDSADHITAEKYFNYTGQPYVTLEYDYSYSLTTSSYTMLDRKSFRADNSLYELLTYNGDGTRVDSFYAITGQSYTSSEIDYDASGHYSSKKYMGYTGQPYVTMISDYSYSSSASAYILLDSQYLRADNSVYERINYDSDGTFSTIFNGVQGHPYTSYEIDYDKNKHYTEQKYVGYVGANYVAIYYLYSYSSTTSSYTLIDEKYVRSDNSIYKDVAFSSDGSSVDTYYNITGQPYTSDVIDYDKTGHYFRQIYNGYSGKPYVSVTCDYSYNASKASYTLLDQIYTRADNSVYEKIVFNLNGARSATFYNVTGQGYTSYEIDYDAAGHYTRQTYFNYTGLPYVTVVYDYSYSVTTASYRLVDEQFLRADNSVYERKAFNTDGTEADTYYVTGFAYTSYEYDFDTAQRRTEVKFLGYTGTPYVSLYDFYSYSTASGYFLTEQKYLRSDNSVYRDTIFNTDGTHSDRYYGVTGQSYTSYELDYDVSNHYTAIKYFGYVNQPYVTVEADYSYSTSASAYTLLQEKFLRADNSVYLSEAFASGGAETDTYYGLTGLAYTSEEIDYAADHHVTAEKYFGYTGQTYTAYEQDYSATGAVTRSVYYAANGSPLEIDTPNADGSLTRDFYQVSNASSPHYSSYEVVYEANGTERSQTFNYDDGTHEIDAEENNVTVVSTSGDDRIFGLGSGISFQFNPGFGHDTIMDFYSHLTSADASHLADTVLLPKTEFANFAALLSATTPGSSGTVSTATNGDSLTLYGMTLTALQSAAADFKFV